MRPTQHQVVLQDKTGQVWEGEVVAHMPLQAWCEWRGYLLLEWEGFHPATLHHTQLNPMPRKRSGIYVVASQIRQLLSHLG